MINKRTSLKEIFSRVNNAELILPNFQRDFEWKEEDQKLLLASFLVDLPIGSFLILEGNSKFFSNRELCFKRATDVQGDCLYLLDGQQRLSTLKNIFTDHLSQDKFDNNFDDLHFHLKNRWFLDLSFSNENDDLLGIENLNFKINTNNLTKYKLSSFEPNEIIDKIKHYKILKSKNVDKFYHPKNSFGTSDSYGQKIEFAKHCSLHENNQLPLFSIFSNDNTIIKNFLKEIAQKRMNVLMERVNQNSILSSIYLGHIDGEIVNKYKEGLTDQINKAWEDLMTTWIDDVKEYFNSLFRKEMYIPHIESTELHRATSVFEYMNKGGVALSTFDIMVAKFAKPNKDYTLSELLDLKLFENVIIPKSLSELNSETSNNLENLNIKTRNKLDKKIKTQFLNILALFTKLSNSALKDLSTDTIKKKYILGIKENEFSDNRDKTIKALIRSLFFLQYRSGIHSYNGLSYELMLLPIAYQLQRDSAWENKEVIDKIEFWYWTALFSGRFRENQSKNVIEELIYLNNWIQNDDGEIIMDRIQNLFKETNYCDLDTFLMKNDLNHIPSSIHKGLLQYVLSKKPYDLNRDNEYKELMPWEINKNDVTLQDHHIIPLGSQTTLGESSKELRSNKKHPLFFLNSPLNRTYISKKSNNEIKSLSIEKYLPILEFEVSSSHLIPSDIDYSELKLLDEQVLKSFLKRRFDSLKTTLVNELKELKN